jgi:hypothetical protein
MNPQLSTFSSQAQHHAKRKMLAFRYSQPEIRSRTRRLLAGVWTIPGGPWVHAVYVFTDLFFIIVCGMTIFYSRFVPNALSRLLGGDAPGLANLRSLPAYEIMFVIYAALVLFFFEYYDLYRTARNRTSLEESLIVSKVLVLVTLLMTTGMYALKIQVLSRFVFGMSFALNVLTLVGWRYGKRRVVNGRIARGKGVRNILIVTAGESGLELARILSENRHLGYVVRGFIAENGLRAPNVLGKIADLRRVAQANFIDEIFIAPPLDREVVKHVAVEAQTRFAWPGVIPCETNGEKRLQFRVSQISDYATEC